MAPLRKTNAPQPHQFYTGTKENTAISAGAGKPNTTYHLTTGEAASGANPCALTAPTLSNGSANYRSARAKAC